MNLKTTIRSFIFLWLIFAINSCHKNSTIVKKNIYISGELVEWSNFNEYSWWIYKDVASDTILDTMFLFQADTISTLEDYERSEDSIFHIRYIDKFYKLDFTYNSFVNEKNENIVDICGDFIFPYYEYYFSSMNNTIIISPNIDMLYSKNGYQVDTIYSSDSSWFILNYHDPLSKIETNKAIELYLPLSKGQEYSDDCNYYSVLDFFDTYLLNDNTYSDVYYIKSYTYTIDDESAYFYVWINKDYGLIKLKIEKDTLIREFELIDANIL